ncbi:phosphatidylinositol-3,4,5-trisphosphate 3-phosphatase PTEN [Cordyceps militaris]|uniref:Phosphatidylinositol-3,4,5-trisphosphate 3-phosphatase PTEN n=1 Tax=Cordyceps militaris TaxID=73501 RepID=A0A2H4SHK4_CORMI|nr:phosphatidylinositol-3,4,5-trisphosphate 3-phosphatase PTEN [Cordyceps militaris]
MTSVLRSIVAGPRKAHPEARLDLCYVTDYIIATSGPSHTYPRRAYRNPLDELVAFLDGAHGADWAIWEFRAEGTGYPDALAHDRVLHFPFPDHHPPPFALVPRILASMRHWLHGGALDGVTGTTTPERHPHRVVVVHCKAVKGRSGTASVCYMLAEEGWRAQDALARFTERRMRFGAGVSIPSQLRWVAYVDRWTHHGKQPYADRPLEIVEIHVWGLRNGVRVDVEAFAEQGRRIELLHTFSTEERHIVRGDPPTDGGFSQLVWDMAGLSSASKAPADADFASATNKADTSAAAPPPAPKTQPDLIIPEQPTAASSTPSSSSSSSETEPGGMAVIFRPATPIRVPHSDVNIAVERRHRAHKRIGLTAVSAVGHVWFNAFFEGRGPEQGGRPDPSGVFTITWDAMDGIRGTSRKGSRGLDKMSVVWRFADEDGGGAVVPAAAEPVTAVGPPHEVHEKDLGVRLQSPASANVSRASSVRTVDLQRHAKGDSPDGGEDAAVLDSVKTSDPAGAELRQEDTKTVA